ncbi:MAG: biotin/lipoyl-containing protein [Saccharofermentanales bacterium]
MKKYLITVNGNQYEVEVEEMQADSSMAVKQVVEQPAAVIPKPVKTAPAPAPVAPAPAQTPAAASAPAKARKGSEIVTSPMPGTILKISVTPGQEIKKGQVLCILEAMKMENEIVASRDARIAEVIVTKGVSVNAGDPLVSFE